MSSIFKIKAAVLYLVVGTGMFAADRDMYLAAAGPTPLRFQWDLPQLDPARLLPPLQMSDKVAGTNAAPQTVTESRKPVDFQSEAHEPREGPVNANQDAVMTVPEMSMPVAAEAAETKPNGVNQISPQVLLRYFSRNGTNEVLVPYSVDFTPPVPARTGDSSAIYISK